MPNYNKMSGYGRTYMSSLPLPGAGKIFIVGDSSTTNLTMLKELFDVDNDGDVRFHSTIDAAVGACTVNAGDIILVMPGHTETITEAAGIDLDIAGISVMGLGNGRNRPTINFTTATTADMDVDAANILVENIFFDFTGIDALAAGIDVNSNDFTLRNCEFLMTDSDGQSVLGILTDTNVDRVTIENCRFLGDTSTGNTAAVRIIGGDGHIIHNNYFALDCDTTGAPIENLTTATTHIDIDSNFIWNKHAGSIAGITVVGTSTGTARHNLIEIELDGISGGIVDTGTGATDLSLFENYYVNANGEAGGLILGAGVSTTA